MKGHHLFLQLNWVHLNQKFNKKIKLSFTSKQTTNKQTKKIQNEVHPSVFNLCLDRHRYGRFRSSRNWGWKEEDAQEGSIGSSLAQGRKEDPTPTANPNPNPDPQANPTNLLPTTIIRRLRRILRSWSAINTRCVLPKELGRAHLTYSLCPRI